MHRSFISTLTFLVLFTSAYLPIYLDFYHTTNRRGHYVSEKTLNELLKENDARCWNTTARVSTNKFSFACIGIRP